MVEHHKQQVLALLNLMLKPKSSGGNTDVRFNMALQFGMKSLTKGCISVTCEGLCLLIMQRIVFAYHSNDCIRLPCKGLHSITKQMIVFPYHAKDYIGLPLSLFSPEIRYVI